VLPPVVRRVALFLRETAIVRSAASAAPTGVNHAIKHPASPGSANYLALQVLRSFRVLMQSARQHFAQTRQRTGLTGAQLWALSEIIAAPDMRLTTLARLLNLHQTTASNLVLDLVSGGLIEKVPDASDRRSINLRATSEGMAALAAAPRPHEGVLPTALRSLQQHELEALHLALQPLIRHLDPAEVERFAQTPMSDILAAGEVRKRSAE